MEDCTFRKTGLPSLWSSLHTLSVLRTILPVILPAHALSAPGCPSLWSSLHTHLVLKVVLAVVLPVHALSAPGCPSLWSSLHMPSVLKVVLLSVVLPEHILGAEDYPPCGPPSTCPLCSELSSLWSSQQTPSVLRAVSSHLITTHSSCMPKSVCNTGAVAMTSPIIDHLLLLQQSHFEYELFTLKHSPVLWLRH